MKLKKTTSFLPVTASVRKSQGSADTVLQECAREFHTVQFVEMPVGGAAIDKARHGDPQRKPWEAEES